jgi:hypothetical protein
MLDLRMSAKLLRALCFVIGHSWYRVVLRINLDDCATAEAVIGCARCRQECPLPPTWDHDYWPPRSPHTGYKKAPSVTFSGGSSGFALELNAAIRQQGKL